MPPDPAVIKAIDAHAGGATIRLLVDGLPPLRGQTVAQRRAWVERHAGLVSGLVCEPRGHADLLAAVLTGPVAAQAVAGLLFLGVGEAPAISGPGIVAAVTIALERGLLVVADPAEFLIETPGGLVTVSAAVTSRDGRMRVREVAYRPPPVFVARAALPVTVDGRTVHADVVWASGWYAIVDREALGLPSESGHADLARRTSRRLLDALALHVDDWRAPAGCASVLEGVVLTGPPGRDDADLRSLTVYADGSIDRSPSGGGTAAVLSVLDAMGVLDESGRGVVHEGPSGLTFRGRIVGRQPAGLQDGLLTEITGQAWITAEHTFLLDPADPLVAGFVL